MFKANLTLWTPPHSVVNEKHDLLILKIEKKKQSIAKFKYEKGFQLSKISLVWFLHRFYAFF